MWKRGACVACALMLALLSAAGASETWVIKYRATVTFTVERVQCIVIESEAMPELVYVWDAARNGYVVPEYAGGRIWVRNLSTPDFTPCYMAEFEKGEAARFYKATGLNARLVDTAPGAPLKSGERRLVAVRFDGAGAVYANAATDNTPYSERLQVLFTFYSP